MRVGDQTHAIIETHFLVWVGFYTKYCSSISLRNDRKELQSSFYIQFAIFCQNQDSFFVKLLQCSRIQQFQQRLNVYKFRSHPSIQIEGIKRTSVVPFEVQVINDNVATHYVQRVEDLRRHKLNDTLSITVQEWRRNLIVVINAWSFLQ
jgi:hypothetical protein